MDSRRWCLKDCARGPSVPRSTARVVDRTPAWLVSWFLILGFGIGCSKAKKLASVCEKANRTTLLGKADRPDCKRCLESEKEKVDLKIKNDLARLAPLFVSCQKAHVECQAPEGTTDCDCLIEHTHSDGCFEVQTMLGETLGNCADACLAGTTATAETARNGRLHIAMKPKDARVSVDGVVVSSGAQLLLERKPGTYRLEFTRDGYETLGQSVQISPGQDTSTDIEMVPDADTGFDLTSTPKGALV